MIVCLSPNGRAVSTGDGPATTLLIGTGDGIVVLRRPAGGAWQQQERLLAGCHFSSLLHDPVRGGLFAGVHWGGIYRSLDDGATWQRSDYGITAEHVFTLASVVADGQVRLYAGTDPAFLFVSDDYGDSWRELPALRNVPGRERWTFPPTPDHAHVKHIAFDPLDPRTIWLCVEQGALLKSTDGGQAWQEPGDWYRNTNPKLYKDCHRVVFGNRNPNRLYLASGDGLYRSDDRGTSWQHVDSYAFGVGYPDQLIVVPGTDDHLILAGAADSPFEWRRTHDADSRVCRSLDGGNHWETLQNGLPAHLRASIEAMSLHAHPAGFALYVGTTDGDVFASEDGGATWEQIAAGLPPVSKVDHFRNLQPA